MGEEKHSLKSWISSFQNPLYLSEIISYDYIWEMDSCSRLHIYIFVCLMLTFQRTWIEGDNRKNQLCWEKFQHIAKGFHSLQYRIGITARNRHEDIKEYWHLFWWGVPIHESKFGWHQWEHSCDTRLAGCTGNSVFLWTENQPHLSWLEIPGLSYSLSILILYLGYVYIRPRC